jgi:hypothetical protein
MVAPALLVDAVDVILGWARTLTAVAEVTPGGVHLKAPRSAATEHIVLTRVGGGPDNTGDVPLDACRAQFACWGRTEQDAWHVATVLANELLALRGQAVTMTGRNTTGVCHGATLDSISPDPRVTDGWAGCLVQATFSLLAT